MKVFDQIAKEERKAATGYMDEASLMQDHTYETVTRTLITSLNLPYYLKNPFKFMFVLKIEVIHNNFSNTDQ